VCRDNLQGGAAALQNGHFSQTGGFVVLEKPQTAWGMGLRQLLRLTSTPPVLWFATPCSCSLVATLWISASQTGFLQVQIWRMDACRFAGPCLLGRQTPQPPLFL
jgi:hypothetical protein